MTKIYLLSQGPAGWRRLLADPEKLRRTASAVIESRRFKTDAAAMIVHSFSQTSKWFDSFARVAGLFGVRIMSPGVV